MTSLHTRICSRRAFLVLFSFDFFSTDHVSAIPSISKGRTDVQRMLAVVKWFISGWHLRPNGCKKPYNPILGEKFFCFWDLNDAEGSKTEFIGEQVSHHPPISGIHVGMKLPYFFLVLFPEA